MIGKVSWPGLGDDLDYQTLPLNLTTPGTVSTVPVRGWVWWMLAACRGSYNNVGALIVAPVLEVAGVSGSGALWKATTSFTNGSLSQFAFSRGFTSTVAVAGFVTGGLDVVVIPEEGSVIMNLNQVNAGDVLAASFLIIGRQVGRKGK